MLSFRQSWLLPALLGLMLASCPVATRGQTAAPDTVELDTVRFGGMELAGPWQVLGSSTAYHVPFTIPAVEEGLQLQLNLPRPAGLAGLDSVILWLEGVAWRAELLLDDYYLGVHNRPFQAWRVALATAWLQAEGSQLTLRLQPGPASRYHPQPFLGVFRPLRLLPPDSLPSTARPLAVAQAGDTVGLIAPYFGPRQGYRFDSLAALQRLLPLWREGVSQVAFWFEPGLHLRGLCRTMGMREVDSLSPGAVIMMANAYPLREATFDRPPQFWLDEAGQRTQHYGRYDCWEQRPNAAIPRGDRPGLAILLLVPLIGAFLVKLSSPGFFAAQRSLLTQPSLHIENTFYSNVSSTGALLLLTSVRMLVLTSVVALLAYACDRYQLWPKVSVITEHSLFFQVFGKADGLGELCLLSLLVVLVLEGIRHVLMGLIGQIFRIKGLLPSLVSLDIVGSYPLLWGLGIPLGLWLFTEGTEQWLARGLAVIVMLGYWLRRVYVNYQGLDRGASFSSGMKFLYICTFNITPILIWL